MMPKPLKKTLLLVQRGCRAVLPAAVLACAFLSSFPPEHASLEGNLSCLLHKACLAEPAFAAGQGRDQDAFKEGAHEIAHDAAQAREQDTAKAAGKDDFGPLDDPESPDDSGLPGLKEKKRRADLDDSMEELLPLSPDEIRRFMERQDEADSAVSPDPAAMKTRVVSLPCTPQKSPHVVHLAAGYSSAIMFQDVTGAPWPVLTAIVGNAEAFSVSAPDRPDAGDKEKAGRDLGHSHIVTVLPLKAHASGSLVLTLQNAAYPVLLHLVSAGSRGRGRVSDALTVIRLEGQGPSARPVAIGPRPETASDELLSLVHGIVPEKAGKIRTVPKIPGLAVWRCQDRLLVRTPYEAIWPAWLSCAGSEGMKVYAMPVTPSIVLSIDGRAQQVRISEASGEAAP